MGVLSDNAIIGASNASGYSIDQSLSCQSVTSGRLSRTLTSAGSVNPKWTFATWYKKGEPTTTVKGLYIFTASSVGGAAEVDVSWQNDTNAGGGGIRSNGWSGSSSSWDWDMDGNAGSAGGMAFRDYGAWYHICHVVDYTTSPYVFFYVNGVLQDPSTIYGLKSGAGYGTNYSPVSGDTFYIAGNSGTAGCPTGYQADTYWIEGQALNPVGTFGELNEDTGQFVPIEYTGTYTGNSFYLDYADSADFGTDQSGLGNDFTANAFTADQQSIDTPTNNYCTMNPLFASNYFTFTEGNLNLVGPQGETGATFSTIGMSSGKWYFECYFTDGEKWRMGVAPSSSTVGTDTGVGTVIDLHDTGYIYNFTTGATAQTVGTLGSTGDVVGIALNMDDNEVTFYLNNSAYGSTASIGTPTAPWGAYCINYSTSGDANPTYKFNFGQDSSFAGAKTAQGNGGVGEDFFYTPPAGYKALNTDNLPDAAIALPTDHFNSILYTGNGGTQALTGVGFAPDFFWNKNRTATYQHMLYDTVRGVTKYLTSNDIDVEATDANSLTSFDSDGVTLGSSGSSNATGVTAVGWSWKGGGAAVSNTDGSITSSVSANPTAGFSVVGYTSISTTVDETIGHGLSVAPEMVIVKNLDSAWNWDVYTPALSSGYDLKLNTTDAQASGRWSTTAPTASVVTLKYDYEHTSTNDYIAYCFHSVEGYSKIGAFTGAATPGAFVYTGFKPAYLLVKSYSNAGNEWFIFDDKRYPRNVKVGKYLQAQSTAAEVTTAESWSPLDFLSNGIKFRYTQFNPSGYGMIYMAFAESPFKTSNAR